MPKAPRGVRAWHEDIIKAAEDRRIFALHNDKNDFFKWRKACDDLRASTSEIFIQKKGNKAGHVIGIPKSIEDHHIRQTLERIVREEEPILKTDHEVNRNLRVEPDSEGDDILLSKFVKDIALNSGHYAVLAAFYSNTTRFPTKLKELKLKECVGNFTDIQVQRYNHKNRQFGALQGLGTLVDKGFVDRDRKAQHGYDFSLTRDGLRLCYFLFEHKYNPDVYIGARRVRPPPGVTITKQGEVVQNTFGQTATANNFSDEDNDYAQHLGNELFDGRSSTFTAHRHEGSPAKKRSRMNATTSSSHSTTSTPIDNSDIRLARLKYFNDDMFSPTPPPIKRPTANSVGTSLPGTSIANGLARHTETNEEVDDDIREAFERSLKETSNAKSDDEIDFELQLKLALLASEESEKYENMGQGEYFEDDPREDEEDEGFYAQAANEMSFESQEQIDLAIKYSLLDADAYTEDAYDVDPFEHHRDGFAKVLSNNSVEEYSWTVPAPSMRMDYSQDSSSTFLQTNDDFYEEPMAGKAIPLSMLEEFKYVDQDNEYDETYNTTALHSAEKNLEDDNNNGIGFDDFPSDVYDDVLNDSQEQLDRAIALSLLDNNPSPPRDSSRKSSSVEVIPWYSSSPERMHSHSSSTSTKRNLPNLVEDSDSDVYAPMLFTATPSNINRDINGTPLLTLPLPMEHYNLTIIPHKPNIVLLLDTRERESQTFFREFYFKLKKRLGERLESCTNRDGEEDQEEEVVREKCLPLGDIAIAVEDEHKNMWISDCVIERKTLNDIVTRSTGESKGNGVTVSKTGPHMKQEKFLRQSGLRQVFMLLEGDINTTASARGPLKGYNGDEDLENPDVIEDKDALLRYLAGIIGRNYSPDRKVHFLQTQNNAYTILLLTAITVVVDRQLKAGRYLGNNTNVLSSWDSFSSHSNKSKRGKSGREAIFRKILQDGQIHEEMIELLVRRFGDRDSLVYAFKTCYTNHPLESECPNIRCALLMSDLSVGGSQLHCKYLSSDCFITDPMAIKVESIKVWHLVKALCSTYFNFPEYFSSSPLRSVHDLQALHVGIKETTVKMSHDMSDLSPKRFEHFPKEYKVQYDDEIILSFSSMSVFPCMRITTAEACGGVERKSLCTNVILVSGEDLVEALVQATTAQQLRHLNGQEQGGHKSVSECEIVIQALDIIKLKFPLYFGDKQPQQLIVIFEKFINFRNTNSVAMGKLKKLVTMDSSGNLSLSGEESMISWAKDTPLSLNAARVVSANSDWLVQLVLAVASVELGWQCIYTANEAETEMYIKSIVIEAHRQSLLID